MLILISNPEAAQRLQPALGNRNAIYWLSDNRKGRHSFTIPSRKKGNRVFYAQSDIDDVIWMLKK